MNINRIRIQQAGSMILEAMIAILIFSIGILALVGMQASAINTVSDAKYRSTAGFLADQMVGMIRANSPMAINASSVLAASVDTTAACLSGVSSVPCTYGLGANGNSYTQAWASSVATNLPSAVAKITIIGVPGGVVTGDVTVSVGWQAPKDATQHQHIVSTVIN